MTRALTNLEYALLGLVRQSPSSGYELCRVFETTPMGQYSSSPGSIYPALKRLEKRELLLGEVQHAKSMRPRRVFSITDEGLALLRAWVTQPVTREAVVWDDSGLMLRFAFMGGLVGRDETCRFLDQLASRTEELLIDLKSHHKTMKSSETANGDLPTGRFALGFGIETYEALARWARQSFDELQSHE